MDSTEKRLAALETRYDHISLYDQRLDELEEHMPGLIQSVAERVGILEALCTDADGIRDLHERIDIRRKEITDLDDHIDKLEHIIARIIAALVGAPIGAVIALLVGWWWLT